MSLWRVKRYYCANVQGACPYACADTPFTEAEFKRFEGQCRGHRQDGCGSALVLGDPKDLRARWVAALAVAAIVALGMAWAARTFIFPPPLEHIAFATPETTTDDQAALITLQVIRSGDIERRVQVDIASEDGTAKAGEDYGAIRGRLTFEPGQSATTIQLPVMPDHTFAKAARYFSLTLLNVAGEPRHVVRIAPRPVAPGEELLAEQSVLAASRIAADIATFMVKRRVLMDLMVGRASFRDEVAEYKQQLLGVQDNLSRAREGYAEIMRGLQTHQPALIIRTIDRVRDDLVKKQFGQQARALAHVKGKFTELADKHDMDMDRWFTELEAE
jgi:hypothetical protein